jgi:ketosteroid isomerase-like protein
VSDRPIWISLRGLRLPSRRAPEEGLYLRFPALYRAVSRAAFRLRPGSGLRRLVLRRGAAQAAAAWTRRDLDASVIRYDPGAVLHIEVIEGRALLDLEPVYRGSDAARNFVETFHAAWSDLRVQPAWICDLGNDRLVLLQRAAGRGRGSGIELEDEVGHLLRFERGVIVEEHFWWGSWDPPLEAAGLDRSHIPA